MNIKYFYLAFVLLVNFCVPSSLIGQILYVGMKDSDGEYYIGKYSEEGESLGAFRLDGSNGGGWSGSSKKITVDKNNNIYLIDKSDYYEQERVLRYSSEGSFDIVIDNIPRYKIGGLTHDAFGNLYLSISGDSSKGSIIKISPDGVSVPFADFTGESPNGIAFDKTGTELYALFTSGAINKYSLSGEFIEEFITGAYPHLDIAIDSQGRVYVEFPKGSTALLSPSGEVIRTFPDSREFAVDDSDNIYMLSILSGGLINKFSASGELLYTISAPEGYSFSSIAVSQIPEPMTWAFLIVGGAFALLFSKRKPHLIGRL